MIGIEEEQAVLRVIRSGLLSGYRGSWGSWFYGGEEIQALEKEWTSYFGVKHAIACNSATSGLWLACTAIGLQKKYSDYESMSGLASLTNLMQCISGMAGGKEQKPVLYKPDEVIVSPYSMTCSASMPLHFGAKSIFADIEPDYFCLDPKSIEERITERTKAIIVVDLFGQCYDVDAINAIAKKHGIYVIEDAAQACGAKYKGKYAGTLGDIGVYSLNVHKHIQCGEGGIVVTDNDELAFKIRLCMNHSESVMNDMYRQAEEGKYSLSWMEGKPYYESLIGMNLRMTEISAAIAREQLKKLDSILKVYQENAKYFDIPIRGGCTSAYYKYASLNMPENPNPELFNMKEHYISTIYSMPLFKQLGYADNLCPVCEDIERRIKLAWMKNSV